MDKVNALKISVNYLKRVQNNFKVSEAWLFGSHARGNQTDDSDIDLAIVLEDGETKNFDTEVKLMVLRDGEETIIEPHAFTKDEFEVHTPIVEQIINNGERINF